MQLKNIANILKERVLWNQKPNISLNVFSIRIIHFEYYIEETTLKSWVVMETALLPKLYLN